MSAILLFALFTTILTLWTVATLPQWIADREQEHAHGVQESFGAVAAGVDSLSASGDTGPSTVPFALGARPVTLLQTTPSTGELGVQGAVSLTATFTGESLLFADGRSLGEPDEDIDEGLGDTLADVDALQALVLRLVSSGVGNGEEAWISVVADDGDETVTAELIHAGKPGGSDPNEAGCLNSELRLEVTTDLDPAGPTTSIQALLCELGDDLAGYNIDLASPAYGFLAAVERLDAPYVVTLTDETAGAGVSATASFAALYLDSNGLQQSAGSGSSVDYALDSHGARLAYDPSYQSYADQEVAWEFGAMLVTQDDGAVVLRPGFQLSIEDGLGRLDWTVVELQGEGSRSGSGAASARLTHEATTDLVLSADAGVFTLTTPSAGAWRAFLETQAALAEAGADATVGGAGTTATLTLGTTVVTEWRVHLRIIEATVEVL